MPFVVVFSMYSRISRRFLGLPKCVKARRISSTHLRFTHFVTFEARDPATLPPGSHRGIKVSGTLSVLPLSSCVPQQRPRGWRGRRLRTCRPRGQVRRPTCVPAETKPQTVPVNSHGYLYPATDGHTNHSTTAGGSPQAPMPSFLLRGWPQFGNSRPSRIQFRGRQTRRFVHGVLAAGKGCCHGKDNRRCNRTDPGDHRVGPGQAAYGERGVQGRPDGFAGLSGVR